MNPHDCIIRNDVIDAEHPYELWSSIIVPVSVKERLRNHAVLAFSLRRELAFQSTALHGLILLH